MKKLVAYIRVSTQKQGLSGLGLEGQEAAIAAYARQVNGKLIHTYREVESGRKANRSELERAIDHARRIRGCLVIAKLDRLARDVEFIAHLLKDSLDFVACDFPQANKLTLQIMSVIAENEADMISQRTKAALAAAKARGVKLGSARPGHWQGREETRRQAGLKASQSAKAKRDSEFANLAKTVLPVAAQMRDSGETLQAIADKLNEDGYTTLRGKPWTAMQVFRFLSKQKPTA